MKKILFIGMPGSGKGTQAQFLEKYKIKNISVGELIRNAFERNDPALLPYKRSVAQGKLIPDKITFELLEKSLKNLEDYLGYLLDGACRTLAQAKIAMQKNLINEVVFFELSKQEAIKRLFHRAKTSNIKRTDDNLKTIEKRFEVYKKETKPVLDFFKKNIKKFHTINATPSVEQIHKEVVKVLELK